MESLTSSPLAALPRVEYAPPSASSYGDLAARLARAAGLNLEPWQAEGLRTMLAVDDRGKWSSFEYAELCPRQNGKTAFFMARALAGLFLLNEQVVLWSAHEFKTSMRAFRDLRRLIRALGTPVNDTLVEVDGIPVKVNNSAGQEGFERLDTGQELKMVARSKGSGRGFSVDCMIVDEAFAYNEEQQDALMPTLSARPNPQICYASSPPLSGRSGAPLFALRARAEGGGDETLGYRDWGSDIVLDELLRMPPAEREAILDDRDLWRAHNPAFGLGRVDETSVLRLRRSLTDAGFAREILGMWPREAAADGQWRVVAQPQWAGLADPASQIVGPVVMTIDCKPDQSAATIGVGGTRGDGVGHVEIAKHGDGTGWVLPEVVRLNREWRPKAWLVDPASPAGSLLEELQEAHIEPLLVTGREFAQACGSFYRAVTETGAVRHRDQPELNRAVADAVWRPLADARAWDRRSLDSDISPLVAVTLAWHGAQKNANRRRPPRIW